LQKPFRGDTSVSKEMRGIAITLAAMLLFALMDAVSKYLSTRYPTPQILWLRYLFTVPLLLVVLPPRRFSRSVAAGFSGVLIVLRPGLDVVQSSTLVVLVAVLLYALYQVLTRLVGRVDGAETSLLWQTVIGTIVLGGVAAFFWQTPALEHWLLFILTAVLGGSGHFLLIRALQIVGHRIVHMGFLCSKVRKATCSCQGKGWNPPFMLVLVSLSLLAISRRFLGATADGSRNLQS
jgi:drug/metabolite transporter (DMT)-like permease